jgi:tetratricopeptide (TPR) repeat protein
MIWATLVEKCRMKQLIKAGNRNEFTTQWNLLVFHFSASQSRSDISILGKELSHRLFPNEEQEEIIVASLMEAAKPKPSEEKEVGAYEALKRAEKQIAAIAKAVSKGRDAKAEKFLNELIRQQTSFSGGESHVVKSLCNIAQRCADMFRMDFEVVCLNKALQLAPSDGWTLIQYGNHMKRVGNYDKALEIFGQAEKLGESDIARSSIADVYSQQGDYAMAIRTYKAILNWNHKPEVCTAIADNLRRMGLMDESKIAYMKLIHLAQKGLSTFANSEIRAQLGIAEIAKRQGKLKDALQIYNRIMTRKDVDDREKLFCKLGLCHVLKSMNKFHDAYAVVDEIIQSYPFSMEARFIRGSILGLIGQELKGLRDLPESIGLPSWREWLRPFYRGLLLLKLQRYGDAKKSLIEELSNAIASGEEKSIVRMAAALFFLREDKTDEVDGILSQIPDLYDCHAQYLSLILKLHLATLKEDLALMESLRKQIAEIRTVDESLEKAAMAIGEKNFSLAVTYETEALLKLAA